MKSELTLIPKATIHPNKICLYNQVIWEPAKPKRQSIKGLFSHIEGFNDNFKDSTRTANGLVSKIAKQKIERALDYLLLLSVDHQTQHTRNMKPVNFKMVFITLTLPSKQIHTDNEIKNSCLNQFIIEIKDKYKVENYLWRAEKQKNGNIHFHIVTDKFIPWSEIRDRWNRIVNKLGYVDKYRQELKAYHKNGFQVREDLLSRWDYKSQVRAYEAGKANDYNNPNSTDIHSIKKISNIKAYISKYVTKNETDLIKLVWKERDNIEQLTEDEVKTLNKVNKIKKSEYLNYTIKDVDEMLVKGRIWGSNHELADIKGSNIELDSHTEKEIKHIESTSGRKVYSGDYFKVIYINFDDLLKFGGHDLFSSFADYVYAHFHHPLQATLSN
jgi:hypothetical protein